MSEALKQKAKSSIVCFSIKALTHPLRISSLGGWAQLALWACRMKQQRHKAEGI